ncbi:MAG: nucleotidyltransferase family protein [Lachnospiraceae bacterium]|nr:nucleotidyltransferase family protein [Lachnospiraceae bacterium]
MNVVGIIAEYNPFHRGHEYQILKLRELCHADYVIIAMSGNFVQRGAPALMDKYSRTLMALSCGADLVLELPSLFATASAEYFSTGGVCLLNGAGVVTHLGFGAETNNTQLLSALADVLSKEPEHYRENLRRELKAGASFPAARSAALRNYIATDMPSLLQNCQIEDNSPDLPLSYTTFKEIEDVLASPNNILALEYLQALAASGSAIIPTPIFRKGSGYHDTAITEDFCSASAIRSCLREKSSFLQTVKQTQTANSAAKNGRAPLPETAMPKAAYDILNDYPHPFLFEDDLSALLHYELLTGDTDRLAAWGDSSPEIANRLAAEREHFTNWSGFCQHMKTKNITHARLCRLFTHMLLHIRQEDYRTFTAPAYLRVLGFRKSAAPLLTAIKSHGNLPLITNPADAERFLSPESRLLWQFDMRGTELYRLCLAAKGDYSMKNDYRQQIICL